MILTRKLSLLAILFFGIGLAAPVWGNPLFNTWTNTSTNMTVGTTPINVNEFAFSPNYAVDQTVFAATSAGVFKSEDRGFNWTLTAMTSLASSIAISPNYATDRALIAGTGQGVRRTTNGGDTWTDISSPIPPGSRNILMVAFSPDYAHDGTYFAGTFDSGLYKATNINSPNWVMAGMNASNSRISSLVFSPGYASDRVVFAGAENGAGGVGGVYKSSNGGDSWNAVSTWLSEPVHRQVMALAISPNYQNDHTLFAGLFAGGIYKSTDTGNSLVFLPGTENLTIQALAFSPNYVSDGTVFAGEDNLGCYLSTDGGKNWRTDNSGFGSNKSIVTLAFPPNQISQPFNIFAGLYGGKVWQTLFLNVRLFLPLIIH